MALPPLLSERPPAQQRLIPVVGPIVGGAVTGISLGLAEGAWLAANIIMILGGVAAGFDHGGAVDGAKRGAFGGLVFGLTLVATVAIVGMDRHAKVPDPLIAIVILTTVVSIGLGALGGALRARAQARAVVSEPVV